MHVIPGPLGTLWPAQGRASCQLHSTRPTTTIIAPSPGHGRPKGRCRWHEQAMALPAGRMPYATYASSRRTHFFTMTIHLHLQKLSAATPPANTTTPKSSPTQQLTATRPQHTKPASQPAPLGRALPRKCIHARPPFHRGGRLPWQHSTPATAAAGPLPRLVAGRPAGPHLLRLRLRHGTQVRALLSRPLLLHN